MCQLTGVNTNSSLGGGGFAIYRNGTAVWTPSQADATGPYMFYQAAAASSFTNVPLNYVDSPSTTSSTTYAIYWRSYNGSSFYLGGVGTATTSGQHSLILMEVSGS